MNRELSRLELIERSILKKYRDTLWVPFVAAVRQYELLQEGDRVAVCISGGKDSMLLAKLMQQLQKISDFPFSCIFLVMDPGYNAENRKKIEENAATLQVPLTIFETNIFNVANKTEQNPCYLCARMRRGHLYAKAKELGCNKIALGHHMNDVVETTLLGMMYGSQLQAMLPRLGSTNFEGMELIRPLYRVLEKDIISWRNYNQLDFIQCACRFTEESERTHGQNSKRQEIKQLLAQLKKTNPQVEQNIFQSLHKVHLDTFVGYKTGGVEHSFLEKLSPAPEPPEQPP